MSTPTLSLEELTSQGYATGKELDPFTVKEFKVNHGGEWYPKRQLTDGSTWGYGDEDCIWSPDKDRYSF